MLSTETYWTVLYWIDLLAAVACSLLVLSRRYREPAKTLSWILAFFLLPFVGVGLFAVFGFRSMRRRKRRKPRPHARSAPGGTAADVRLPDEMAPIAKLAASLTSFPPVGGNRLTVYLEAKETMEAFISEIESAEHHVHLEFFIVNDDATGAWLREVLVRKAKEGVKCRLLVDDAGSYALGSAFAGTLTEAGVEFARFGPLRIHRPWSFHLRNHRKLVIIDGVRGFIGSQNIGDEYSDGPNCRNPWRDVALKIEGPGVEQMQSVFLEDWEFTTGESLTPTHFDRTPPACGDSVVQLVPTGVDESENALEILLLSLFSLARSHIRIVTPYLAPPEAFVLTLENASRRGVQTEILLPERSDHRLIDFVGRSWCRDLVRARVAVYFNPECMMHSKTITIDDKVALVGSPNMDQRSFRYNFESSILVYDQAVIGELHRDFEQMKEASYRLPSDDPGDTFLRRVAEGAAKAFSDIL